MITAVFSATGWNAQHERGRVDVRMWWDENDPLVVWASLMGNNEASWALSRELLVEGSASAASVGEGDILVRKIGRVGVMLHLRSPEGALDVMLPYRITLAFLDRIEQAMPIGGDRESVVVDHLTEAFLADLENEEERP